MCACVRACVRCVLFVRACVHVGPMCVCMCVSMFVRVTKYNIRYRPTAACDIVKELHAFQEKFHCVFWLIIRQIPHMFMYIYSASVYEELCTHVGVMVSGTLKKIGTPQDLKRKSGRNVRLTINVGDPMNGTIFDMVTLREHVETIFPGSVVSETRKRQVT